MKIACKKHIVMALFITAYSLGTLAQNFYYYKGCKIPLTINGKVSVSIPKSKGEISDTVLRNVKDIGKVTRTLQQFLKERLLK